MLLGDGLRASIAYLTRVRRHGSASADCLGSGDRRVGCQCEWAGRWPRPGFRIVCASLWVPLTLVAAPLVRRCESLARASMPSYFDAKLQRSFAVLVPACWMVIRKQPRLLLRPWSRPVGVAPRQRQNQAKHNPTKYDAARLCRLSHQHRVYPRTSFFGERLRGGYGCGLADRCRGLPRGRAAPLDRHASRHRRDRREIFFAMTGRHFQDRAAARQIIALAGGPLMLA
jgi:hypothetical protein